jgi:Fic family protein
LRDKGAYYAALEAAQDSGLDVSAWLIWFLGEIHKAVSQGIEEVHRVLARHRFWARAEGLELNGRQRQALQHALSPFNEGESLSNRWYRKITGTNRTTATRDLVQLVALGLLEASGEKRGVGYRVPLERFRRAAQALS